MRAKSEPGEEATHVKGNDRGSIAANGPTARGNACIIPKDEPDESVRRRA